MKHKIKRAILRALILRLFPEGHELALAVYNADFSVSGSADFLKRMARAALDATGEFDS